VSSNRTIFLNSTINKEYHQPMYMIRSPQSATIQYNSGVLVSKIFRRQYLVFLSDYDHQADIQKSDYSHIHQPHQVSQTVGSQYRKSRNESIVFLSDYASVILHHVYHIYPQLIIRFPPGTTMQQWGPSIEKNVLTPIAGVYLSVAN